MTPEGHEISIVNINVDSLETFYEIYLLYCQGIIREIRELIELLHSVRCCLLIYFAIVVCSRIIQLYY